MTTTTEIKKMLKAGSLQIGTTSVVKKLKLGKMQKVLLSSNCPAQVEEDINHFADMNGTEVEKLNTPNDELGTICRKGFSISVLGVTK